jgi:hypothetical protein
MTLEPDERRGEIGRRSQVNAVLDGRQRGDMRTLKRCGLAVSLVAMAAAAGSRPTDDVDLRWAVGACR